MSSKIQKNDNSSAKGKGPLKRKSLWIILALALIITSTVLIAAMKKSDSAVSEKNSGTFTVRRDDLTITVTESGSISARNSIEIKSEVEGQVTIISVIPEGTYITEEDVNDGKILVELDSSELVERQAQRKIDFAGAEATYTQAKEGYDIQVKQNESDVATALLGVKFALMDFEKYLGKSLAHETIKDVNQSPEAERYIEPLLAKLQLLAQTEPNETVSQTSGNNELGEASQMLKKLNDDITFAKANLVQAEDSLAWTKKLREKQYVSEMDLERDKLDVQNLRFKKENSEISMKLFEAYDFSKKTQDLLSKYNEAKRKLDRTYANARSQLAQKLAALKSAEARFNLRKNRLEKAEKQILACTIKAPAAGLVTYGSTNSRWGWREGPIEAGTTVRERQTIITLPDTSEMIVKINVHESSVIKVKPEQKAEIVIEPFPDDLFEGKVLKVAPLPDPQRNWLSPDLKVYTTEVSIEGTHDLLKPGMSAKVKVLVEQIDDCLIVPVQVVANRSGKKVCYVATAKGSKEREVKTGGFNDIFVEIISGLEENEEVLLNPPRLTKSDADAKSEQLNKQKDSDKSIPAETEDVKPKPVTKAGKNAQSSVSAPPAGGQRPK